VTAAELADLFDVVATRSRGLRDAGVREIGVGDIRITLAPIEPSAPIIAAAPAHHQPGSVAEDPVTYGRRPGDPVPGLDWANDAMREAMDRRDRELGRRK